MEEARKRILLVDDDRTISHIVSGLLRSIGGYDVLVENDSEQALTKAREFLPDLVVLDVDMPRLDGGEVAFQLKGDTQFSHVPIIFLSSLVTPADERNTEARYLSKASSPDALVECVEAALA